MKILDRIFKTEIVEYPKGVYWKIDCWTGNSTRIIDDNIKAPSKEFEEFIKAPMVFNG